MDISSLENNAKELEKSVIIAKQNKKNIESEISSLKAKCTKLENDNLMQLILHEIMLVLMLRRLVLMHYNS